MADFVKVASVADFKEDSARSFEIQGKTIAIVRLEDGYFAIDDTCTHADASLAEGWIEDGEIVCPLHAARFCVRSGEARTPPAFEGVETYPVRVEGDDILVAV